MSLEALRAIIRKKDIITLCKVLFQFTPTPKQSELIRKIAYRESRRINVSAMTRYGKSKAVSVGIAILILFNKDLKIAFIGPKEEQAAILRDNMADLLLCSPVFRDAAQINVLGFERIKKEASKKRQTFKNGCEYRIFSAYDDGMAMMGFGADVVVKDEACLISRDADAKIMRMLGDNPESAILIELYNPWTMDSKAFEHSIDPSWDRIRIDWRTALSEGRVTQEHIDEMRKELTPLEFQVLYESDFPSEAEDSVFNYDSIKASFTRELPGFKRTRRVLGCDVADKGVDKTVIMAADTDGQRYIVDYIYSESKSENTAIAGRLARLREEQLADAINVDSIGIGVGVVSMLKQNVHHNCRVVGCHFGNAPRDPTRFANRKAEAYFRLKALFNEGLIKIPEHKQLVKELLSMRWKHTDSGKIKIIDPDDKSPDYADALVYTVWSYGSQEFHVS